MNAKEKHLEVMIEYWGDPGNTFITRAAMHRDVLKISGVAFYKHFPPAELLIIEVEASDLRRANSSRERSEVMDSLLKEAKGGNVTAAREFLDRTEGKVLEKRQLTGKDGGPIETKSTLEAGPGVSAVLQALEEATTKGQDDSDGGGDKE